MTSHEARLRRDLELVRETLGFIERIPEKPSEPIRDPVSSEPSRLDPESMRYLEFLMGAAGEDGMRSKGAWEELSPILSSYRLDKGLSDFNPRHGGWVQPTSWVNTTGHEVARRQLIAFLEDIAEHLRTRIKRECAPRRKRTGLRSWADLNTHQHRILIALAETEAPQKGAILAKHLGLPSGTLKPYISALVKAGFIASVDGGYVFERAPEDAPQLGSSNPPREQP